MFGLILTLHVSIAIILVFIVLLQSGKGSEMGAAFGGIGQASSARGEMSGLGKFTATIAAIFMVSSLALAYLSSQETNSSVVSKLQAFEADFKSKNPEATENPELAPSVISKLQAFEADFKSKNSESAEKPEVTPTEQQKTLEQTDAPAVKFPQNSDQ